MSTLQRNLNCLLVVLAYIGISIGYCWPSLSGAKTSALPTPGLVLIPGVFPLPRVRFMNFDQGAICISAYNSNRTQKNFVDGFAYWACSHYLTSVVIRNQPLNTHAYMHEPELIQKNRAKIIERLRASGVRSIDLYLFGHSNNFSGSVENLIRDAGNSLGYPVKIRFVYNSGCNNFADDGFFQKQATTYVGHKELNFGGNYTPMFLIAWFNTFTAGQSMRAANWAINRKPFTESRHSLNGRNDPTATLVGRDELRF